MLLLFSVIALPVSAAQTETVEVFVTLDGDGLAEAAMAVGSAVDYAATEAGAAAIAGAQARLAQAAAAIEALPGAEVLGQNWFLSLSLGVRLPASQLERLAALAGVVSVELISTHAAAALDEEEWDEADAGEDSEVLVDTLDKPDPFYAPELMGVSDLQADGVLGEGVLAAVIDTGFDLEHPVFSLPDGVTGAMTLEDVAEVLPLLSFGTRFTYTKRSAEQLWVSEKVPFAYDYNGQDLDVQTANVHGTHVASILAGGTDENGKYVGVAPGAQLILMKVFGDGSQSYASDYALYCAVEDAVLLGADVISLSLGSAPGYPYATNTFSIYKHLEKARSLGCVVVCAVGNDGAVGEGSAYDQAREIDFPLAANPDYGLVADPASYASTLAVGAYVPDKTLQSGLGSGDGELFGFADSAAGQGFGDMGFVEVLEGQTLDYVVVPGVGRASDYEGLDLTGRLALVRRGEITFTEKLLAAAEAGAVGMICYDNEDGEGFNMALDEMPIPAVSVTKSVGERLAGLPEAQRTVTVSAGLLRLVEPEDAGKPADYSTRGSGLTIRPSVMAPGTVYAAMPGGGYRSQGGTSMATPMIAGLCALSLGQLDEAARSAWDTAALDELVADLITTASPILDESGYPYPIRVQGGGAVQADAFLGAETALRASDGRGLIELGDGLAADGQFTLTVTLTNRSHKTKTYAVSASVGSDDYFLLDEEGEYTAFAADRARVFRQASLTLSNRNINRYGEDTMPYTLTLSPGESRELTISCVLSAEETRTYSTYFSNGYYLEGYVWVESGDGEQLTLPYLGFAGDFDALPYLDEFGYDGGKPFFPQSYLFGYAGETALNLGCSYYDENGVFRADLIAISPDGDGYLDTAYVNLYLLRNLYSFEIEVTDAEGNAVWKTNRSYYLTKTFLDDNDRLQTTTARAWDGSDDDNADYSMPDGRYTVTFRVLGPGDVVKEETTLPIVVDTAAPRLTETQIEVHEDGTRRLTVTLEDDHYPMRAVLYRSTVDEYGREVELYRDAHNISYREGRRAIRLTYDITAFEGDYLYLDVYDYAMNRETYRIPLG